MEKTDLIYVNINELTEKQLEEFENKLDERIQELENEIEYEKRKQACCATGKSDLFYIVGLENELDVLKRKRDEI